MRPKEMRGRSIYQNPGESDAEEAPRREVMFNQRKPHKEESVE